MTGGLLQHPVPALTPETSDDENDQEYEQEYAELNRLFPNANFSVCVRLDELDTIISTKPFIVVKYSRDCYCYTDCPKEPDYYRIVGPCLTLKYVITELIRQGLKMDCNHYFFESLELCKDSDFQYEIGVGS